MSQTSMEQPVIPGSTPTDSDMPEGTPVDQRAVCLAMGICHHCFNDESGYIYLDKNTLCPRCEDGTYEEANPEVAYECPNCKEPSYNPYDEENHCSGYCARGNPPTTCWGCQQEQPNQLAHMDKGGCLYNPEDDSDNE